MLVTPEGTPPSAARLELETTVAVMQRLRQIADDIFAQLVARRLAAREILADKDLEEISLNASADAYRCAREHLAEEADTIRETIKVAKEIARKAIATEQAVRTP